MGNLESKNIIEPPPNLENAEDKLTKEKLEGQLTEPRSIIVVIMMAPYCSTSRELNSELPYIAKDFPTVQFKKVNTEKNLTLPTDFNAQTFPYIGILYKNEGGEVKTYDPPIVGNNPQKLRQVLTELTKPPEDPKKKKADKTKKLLKI